MVALISNSYSVTLVLIYQLSFSHELNEMCGTLLPCTTCCKPNPSYSVYSNNANYIQFPINSIQFSSVPTVKFASFHIGPIITKEFSFQRMLKLKTSSFGSLHASLSYDKTSLILILNIYNFALLDSSLECIMLGAP